MSLPTAAETTLSLLRRYYDAFNRQDHAGMLGLLTEDVQHDVNEGGSEHGREAFAAFLRRMDAHYREQVRDLVVMSTEDGARASAEFRILGEYLHTDEGLPEARGQRYDLPVGAFFEVRGGKIARVTNYYNLSRWTALVTETA